MLVHADQHSPWGLDDADAAEIAQYLANPGWSAWTRHTYFVHLAGYYRWAVRAGHLNLDPMLTLNCPPEGDRLPNPVSDAELTMMLCAPDMPWRRAVLLAAYAGLRCCEIVTVRRHDIRDGLLRVRGKGGRYRVVPVADVLWREIDDAPAGPLCVGAQGRPLTAQMLTQMQRPVWRRLGLDDSVRLHRCRHWFATRLLDGGADIRVVQELLGHRSLHSTEGYTAVARKRLSRAVETLPDMQQPEPGSDRLGPQAAEAA